MVFKPPIGLNPKRAGLTRAVSGYESVTAGPQRRPQFPWELQLLPTAATLQLYCIAWTHLSHKTPRKGRRATLPDLSFCISRHTANEWIPLPARPCWLAARNAAADKQAGKPGRQAAAAV